MQHRKGCSTAQSAAGISAENIAQACAGCLSKSKLVGTCNPPAGVHATRMQGWRKAAEVKPKLAEDTEDRATCTLEVFLSC